MELYFKDLISEEASLEKLVDDLENVVQGADEFAHAVEGNLPAQSRDKVAGHLDRLKTHYRRLKEQTLTGARATDRLLRLHPYSFVGVAFAVGLLLGLRLPGRK
jgi:ElaB/YqjD/DUF883 family membrane-anchored ribosome-binding protein